MDEYVLISKSDLADIANKVRSISGSNNTMNALEIDSNLGAQVNSVKETLTNYLVCNGKTVDENMNLKQLANIVETVENMPDGNIGDLLMYNGTKWVSVSKDDLAAEIIASLPNAEEASF